jgi:hypothetical protein
MRKAKASNGVAGTPNTGDIKTVAPRKTA